MKHTLTGLLVALVAALSGCSSGTNTAPASSYHIVSSTDSMPHGRMRDGWIARWLNWVFSTYPNPLPLQERADSGQQVVWFLNPFNSFESIQDTTVGRRVVDTTADMNISSSDAIYFRVLQGDYFNCGDKSQAALTADSIYIAAGGSPDPSVTWGANFASRIGTMQIDGQPISNLVRFYQYAKKPFILHMYDPALYGSVFPYPSDHSKYDCRAAIVALFLDGFSKGDHTIHLQQNDGAFHANVTWLVHVQ